MDGLSLAQAAAALGAHREVELAVVFGSVARGNPGPSSDVDVAVRGSRIDHFRLAAELSVALGREVDVVALDTDDIVLLAEIVQDGRVAIERVPGSYALFRSHALATLEIDLPSIRGQQDAFVAKLARAVPQAAR